MKLGLYIAASVMIAGLSAEVYAGGPASRSLAPTGGRVRSLTPAEASRPGEIRTGSTGVRVNEAGEAEGRMANPALEGQVNTNVYDTGIQNEIDVGGLRPYERAEIRESLDVGELGNEALDAYSKVIDVVAEKGELIDSQVDALATFVEQATNWECGSCIAGLTETLYVGISEGRIDAGKGTITVKSIFEGGLAVTGRAERFKQECRLAL